MLLFKPLCAAIETVETIENESAAATGIFRNNISFLAYAAYDPSARQSQAPQVKRSL